MRGNPEKIKPYRWKRGQPSPNPGGRPRTAILSKAIRAQLNGQVTLKNGTCTVAEAIASVLIGNALSGDIRAIREIADRAEGRPTLAVTVQNGTENLTDDEMETRINELLAATGLRLVPIDSAECHTTQSLPDKGATVARVND